MSDRKRPESVLVGAGTLLERWHFWPEVPALRCQWPTAGVVQRLLERDVPDGQPDLVITRTEWSAIRNVLHAYQHLLTHPAGTEAAVQRLRALRRAERQGDGQG